MKKLKEALIFIISILVLVFGPIVWYAASTPKDQSVFVSNWSYLKMFFKDELFLKALVNTYTIPICVSFAAALTLFLIYSFVKKGCFAKRKIFYPVCLVSAIASAFVVIVMMAKGISVYNCLLSLQVGFVVTFLIWIIELIIGLFAKDNVPLLKIAKDNVNDNKQITVLLTDNKNTYISTEIDGADVIDKLKDDPTVVTMLTMWQSGEVDLPSIEFRKALVALNESNLETDIVLRSDVGYILKKLKITI